jgi:hypothetical protein
VVIVGETGVCVELGTVGTVGETGEGVGVDKVGTVGGIVLIIGRNSWLDSFGCTGGLVGKFLLLHYVDSSLLGRWGYRVGL